MIRRKKKCLLVIHNKVQMHFSRDILMGHHREKYEKIINYSIEEWHTSTPCDIFWNQYNYLTVCLLIDTWQWTDHCISVFGKCIFDSNLKVALTLTQNSLNYIWCDNDTDEDKFIGVLHAIRAVPTEVFQIRLNMK